MNDAGSHVCSSNHYGTLAWAKMKCDNDNKCKWLHRYGCDDNHWRFCSDVKIDGYIIEHSTYLRAGACSKIKLGNTTKFNMSK